MYNTFRTTILKNAMKYVNILLVPLEQHYYHQYSHALEVMDRSIYLAKKEWLSDDEIEMIALAWVFHDTGFVIQYDDNEYIWAKIAKNYLKSILYPEDRIKIIEDAILSTLIGNKDPKNIYEKIIKDADLDNLWRDDFLDQSNNLRREIEAIKNIKLKDPDWMHWTITFLAEHKYFTHTQKTERSAKKKENKVKLETKIKKSP